MANIGTCRVVHSCGKQIGATQLTAEHSCENLSERLRIRHQHPDALHNNSQKRLLGLYAHTRALGGMHMKDRRVADVWNTRHFRRVHPLPGTILTNAIGQRRDVAPYLTSRVGVSSTDLEEGDFVIVATSCFWQCFANEDAVLLASKLLAGAREAGASLTNIAQAMLAECKAPDGGDLDDIALLLLTADGISTAAHNNRDFLVGGVSIQPQPAPAAVPEPESAVTKEACKRGQISSQPPPPPPAIPSKPVSLQTVSRLRERRGAVTATGASGRLLNTPTAEPLRLSPPPLLKPSDPHRLKSTLGAIEGVSKSAKMPAQQLRSSEIERNRLAADPTISRLRIRRGAVTTIGSGGPRSIGADHDRAKTRSLEQPTPTPIQAHQPPEEHPSATVQYKSTLDYVDMKRAELKPLLMPHRVPAPTALPHWHPAPPGRSNGDQAVQCSMVVSPGSHPLTLQQRMAAVAGSWGIAASSESKTQQCGTLKQRMATIVASW